MKWLTDSLKKMDKTKWLVLGLSGILLLVVALPTDSQTGDKEDAAFRQSVDAVQTQEDMIKIYEKQLAAELEQTLGYMDGVGEVHVMLTFKDSGQNVVEKDIQKSENEQNSSQYQESTVYQESDSREPYVRQQKLPSVEGVLVIAKGGGDSIVKQSILDAVMALFPIDAHKVKIVKLGNQS